MKSGAKRGTQTPTVVPAASMGADAVCLSGWKRCADLHQSRIYKKGGKSRDILPMRVSVSPQLEHPDLSSLTACGSLSSEFYPDHLFAPVVAALHFNTRTGC